MWTILRFKLFVLLQIKVKMQKKNVDDDDEEEERNNLVICEECGRSDRRHCLLVCSQCDSGYDTYHNMHSSFYLCCFGMFFLDAFTLSLNILNKTVILI